MGFGCPPLLFIPPLRKSCPPPPCSVVFFLLFSFPPPFTLFSFCEIPWSLRCFFPGGFFRSLSVFPPYGSPMTSPSRLLPKNFLRPLLFKLCPTTRPFFLRILNNLFGWFFFLPSVREYCRLGAKGFLFRMNLFLGHVFSPDRFVTVGLIDIGPSVWVF